MDPPPVGPPPRGPSPGPKGTPWEDPLGGPGPGGLVQRGHEAIRQ